MLRRLYHVAGLFSMAVVLAGGGVAGYLWFAGRLDASRLKQLAAILSAAPADAAAAPAADAAAAQAADGVAAPAATEAGDGAGHDDEPGARTEEAIRAARVREQLRRAVLERASQDVAARQALLDQALAHLVDLQERFEREKTEWLKQKESLGTAARDEGFRRELEYVSKLPARQAKEHVVRAWASDPADVVRLFMAMPPATGKRILAELKTPQELGIMHELLEQIRLADVDRFAAESRTTPGKQPEEP